MVNPTGGKIRNDKAGVGLFGASRGGRRHRGVDLLCVPGQAVLAPISGVYRRIAYPYSGNKEYLGVCLQNSKCEIKLFYVRPFISVGKKIKAGDAIGTAQDISKKYGGGMKPHIHMEISNIDPLWFLELAGENQHCASYDG